MNYKKISVITPSYNQANFLEETILSVLNQNYPLFEHIIMDGGSKDNTIPLLKKYDHIIWKSEPDRGQTHAINKALKIATGDIICWLNSDDLLCSNVFHIINSYFDENPEKFALIGNLLFVNVNNKLLFRSKASLIDYNGLLNYGKCVQQPSTFFRKEVFDSVGFLDESYKYTMDHEFFLRVSKLYKFYTIDCDFARFRVHNQSKTGTSQIKFVNEIFKIKIKYKAKLFSFHNFSLIFMYIKEPIKKIIRYANQFKSIEK
jgi:glycosyltransferase involved in cell wall biosynthesis